MTNDAIRSSLEDFAVVTGRRAWVDFSREQCLSYIARRTYAEAKGMHELDPGPARRLTRLAVEAATGEPCPDIWEGAPSAAGSAPQLLGLLRNLCTASQCSSGGLVVATARLYALACKGAGVPCSVASLTLDEEWSASPEPADDAITVAGTELSALFGNAVIEAAPGQDLISEMALGERRAARVVDCYDCSRRVARFFDSEALAAAYQGDRCEICHGVNVAMIMGGTYEYEIENDPG